jgi:hypothetical protein
MYESKPDNSDNDKYIEYYSSHNFDNSWVTVAFCSFCGITFNPETTGNVYKLKKEYIDNIYFCELCLLELKQRNVIKKWEKIELYWASLQSSPELK